MVVFVDFDGVLHPEPCYREEQLFCFLPLFEQVMRQFPHIDMVVSSSWRERECLEQLRSYFADDIAARIVGTTPPLRDIPLDADREILYPRQFEIEMWMRRERKPWEGWMAVDDRPYWFRPFSKNLIVCDAARGFDDHAAQQLTEKLRAA